MDTPISDSCRYIPDEDTYVVNGYDLYYIDKTDPTVRDLKLIDPGYFVMFNPERGKYEVHNKFNIGSTYCLTTYKHLDERTVEVVRKTAVARADIMARQVREQNEKIDKARARERRNLMEAMAADDIFPKYDKGRIYSTA